MEIQVKSRTVRPDAEAIKRLRLEKGWRVEDLAKNAKCSAKTVENIERGASVYLFTLAKFATALGVEYALLVAGGEPQAESQTKERRFQVQITLSIPFEEFDQTEQLVSLIDLLKRLLPAKDALEVKGLMAGSTIITLEMSEADVRALISAFNAGKLDEMLVAAILLPNDFTHGSISIGEAAARPLTGGLIERIKPYVPQHQPDKSKKPKPDTKP